MSQYLELKAQIEAMQAQLEQVRVAELDEQIADIKKKIIAFGITPEMLFSKDSLGPKANRVVRPARVKYSDGNGNTWNGQGFKPAWFTASLAAGKTPDELLVRP